MAETMAAHTNLDDLKQYLESKEWRASRQLLTTNFRHEAKVRSLERIRKAFSELSIEMDLFVDETDVAMVMRDLENLLDQLSRTVRFA